MGNPSPQALTKIVITLSLTFPAAITGAEPGKERVLLIDFKNQNKVEHSQYLASTIPEAFVGPLQKTGKFSLLSRTKSRTTVKKLKIGKEDLFEPDRAQQAGKVTGADIVVIGNFIVLGERIRIQAKAIDVKNGKTRTSEAMAGKTDGTMFDLINVLAERMAARMAGRKVAPLKTATKPKPKAKPTRHRQPEQRPKKHTSLYLHAFGSYNFASIDEDNIYHPGVGGVVDASFNVLKPWLYPFVRVSYLRTRGQHNDSNDTQFVSMRAGLSYPLRALPLVVHPYLTGGADYARSGNGSTIVPSINSGINVDVYVMPNVAFTINGEATYVADTLFPIVFFVANAGIGLSF